MSSVFLKPLILVLALVSFGAMPMLVHVRSAHNLAEEFSDVQEKEDFTEFEENQSENQQEQTSNGVVGNIDFRPKVRLPRKVACRSERRRLNGLGTYLRT